MDYPFYCRLCNQYLRWPRDASGQMFPPGDAWNAPGGNPAGKHCSKGHPLVVCDHEDGCASGPLPYFGEE